MRWLPVAVVLWIGCATAPSLARYDGPRVWRDGGGGILRSAHGVDFWSKGAPSRRFRPIGIITGSLKDDEAIARLVKANKGEAVVRVDNDSEATDFLAGRADWTGAGKPGAAQYIVVRYEKERIVIEKAAGPLCTVEQETEMRRAHMSDTAIVSACNDAK
jgi:hypothetical protein